MKFFTLFTQKTAAGPKPSEFSRFFREASSHEKKKVYLEVARKASEEQRKIMTESREVVTP